jgi:hypothetical protein
MCHEVQRAGWKRKSMLGRENKGLRAPWHEEALCRQKVKEAADSADTEHQGPVALGMTQKH